MVDTSIEKLKDQLFSCACFGEKETMESLLRENSIESNICDSYGNSLLMEASKYGQFHTVKFLINTNINVNHENCNQSTALHYSSGYGNLEVLKLLIENGAKVDVKDSQGMTPLHWAYLNGNEPSIRYLVDKGADITALDKKNQPALPWMNKFKPKNNQNLSNKLSEEKLKNHFKFEKTKKCQITEIKEVSEQNIENVISKKIENLNLDRCSEESEESDAEEFDFNDDKKNYNYFVEDFE